MPQNNSPGPDFNNIPAVFDGEVAEHQRLNGNPVPSSPLRDAQTGNRHTKLSQYNWRNIWAIWKRSSSNPSTSLGSYTCFFSRQEAGSSVYTVHHLAGRDSRPSRAQSLQCQYVKQKVPKRQLMGYNKAMGLYRLAGCPHPSDSRCLWY